MRDRPNTRVWRDRRPRQTAPPDLHATRGIAHGLTGKHLTKKSPYKGTGLFPKASPPHALPRAQATGHRHRLGNCRGGKQDPRHTAHEALRHALVHRRRTSRLTFRALLKSGRFESAWTAMIGANGRTSQRQHQPKSHPGAGRMRRTNGTEPITAMRDSHPNPRRHETGRLIPERPVFAKDLAPSGKGRCGNPVRPGRRRDRTGRRKALLNDRQLLSCGPCARRPRRQTLRSAGRHLI